MIRLPNDPSFHYILTKYISIPFHSNQWPFWTFYTNFIIKTSPLYTCYTSHTLTHLHIQLRERKKMKRVNFGNGGGEKRRKTVRAFHPTSSKPQYNPRFYFIIQIHNIRGFKYHFQICVHDVLVFE